MTNNVHNTYSTRREDWGTPPKLFTRLFRVFGFTMDLAANKKNHLTEEWMGPGGIVEDTLSTDLSKHIPADEWAWCNPPHNRKSNGPWAKKLMTVPQVVALVPASPGSDWFAPYWGATALCWVAGRLQFAGAPGKAQFDSVIVVRGDINQDQIDILDEWGNVTWPRAA